MKLVTLYSGSSGLNTVLDPQRLSQGSDKNPGMIELAQAVNVSIDDRGLITLRVGDILNSSGAYHSLFCDGGDCFLVKDNSSDATLYKVTFVGDTATLTSVRTGLTKGARVSFVQANDITLYANGAQNGIITSGVSGSWGADTYNGPDHNVSFLASVPVGNHLGYDRAGTVAIARGGVVFFNYLLFMFGLFSMGRGWVQYPSNIRMVKSVASGWYVSDQRKTYFLRGLNWNDFVESVVAEYPAHEWSCSIDYVEASDAGLDSSGECAVWSSPRGICLGMPDGRVINLTKDKVDYPTAYERAACLLYDNKKIINTVY